MIAKDNNQKLELDIQKLEYLASFWNYEAVQQVRTTREQQKSHAFASDEEFERQLKEQTFKKNKIADIAKNTNLNNDSGKSNKRSRFRVPRNFGLVKSIVEESDS